MIFSVQIQKFIRGDRFFIHQKKDIGC
jgi:hypothetical protein